MNESAAIEYAKGLLPDIKKYGNDFFTVAFTDMFRFDVVVSDSCLPDRNEMKFWEVTFVKEKYFFHPDLDDLFKMDYTMRWKYYSIV